VPEDLYPENFLSLPLAESPWDKAAEKDRTEDALFATPSESEQLALRSQRIIGHLLLLPFAGFIVFLMRWVRGYHIENIKALRAQFAQVAESEAPLIICANHLTFIDSALMIWAFSSNWRYLFHYRQFSWNLPAGDFFKKRFYFRMVAYLTKCIFIHRDGSKAHKDGVLAQCHWLLNRGEIVSIFPEGRRSRIGRFDRERITYGVGKLLAATPGCRALCVYVRGDKQEKFTDYPPKHSIIRFRMRLIVPRSDATGRDAYGALASQVADTLLGLEQEHFEEHGS